MPRSYGNIAPRQWVIPLPSPPMMLTFQNTNRNTLPFLRAAGIKRGSQEHMELRATIQALHRQCLHPFKYLEEQEPNSVDRLIEKARIKLPWLDKYEDSWPARIYLKRYVDARRPHLMCTKYAHSEKRRERKSRASHGVCPQSTENLEDSSDVPEDNNLDMRDFLGSLTPSLEHHLDAFIQLGIKDQETLRAFLSWPQFIQTQFLDEGREVLQLTSLERKSLLVGCGSLVRGLVIESLSRVAKPGNLCS